MYRLELDTLLLVLRDRSGLLEAFLPSVPGLRGRCQVVVTLVQGKVGSCMIGDQHGGVISGERALQVLQKKVLEWAYREQQIAELEVPGNQVVRPYPEVPMQQSPRGRFPGELSPRPEPGYRGLSVLSVPARRVEQPPPQVAQSWTRLQRSVFMLIDGTRSIGVIANLLRQDEESVLAIVAEMAHYGIIRFS